MPRRSRGAGAGRVRHGCWLVALMLGISAVALVVVGSFGLVGTREVAAVVIAAAALVLWRDRRVRRGGTKRVPDEVRR